MADIYLVAERRTEERFILRLMLPEHRLHWTQNRQFKWGCYVMSHLDHPNIVKLVESGKFRGQRFAILEYVEGSNLRECMLRFDAQLKTHRLKLLIGMASALAHLHERGFIHLDFKPENIVVSPTYSPKLVDFDLAISRPSRPKKASTLSGTFQYLAPEQIDRQPLDERADIFAFGVTAYELVTGVKPITGNSREEIVKKFAKLEDHLRHPRSVAPDVPAFLEKVILKCLEKNMERRYPSMQLVVRDLL